MIDPDDVGFDWELYEAEGEAARREYDTVENSYRIPLDIDQEHGWTAAQRREIYDAAFRLARSSRHISGAA